MFILTYDIGSVGLYLLDWQVSFHNPPSSLGLCIMNSLHREYLFITKTSIPAKVKIKSLYMSLHIPHHPVSAIANL
jgi:hypothetical protein